MTRMERQRVEWLEENVQKLARDLMVSRDLLGALLASFGGPQKVRVSDFEYAEGGVIHTDQLSPTTMLVWLEVRSDEQAATATDPDVTEERA